MRVLFTDGPWRIIVWDTKSMVEVSSIQHRCEVSHGATGTTEWWYYASDGKCGVCDELAPDSIIGLHMLHNWDR